MKKRLVLILLLCMISLVAGCGVEEPSGPNNTNNNLESEVNVVVEDNTYVMKKVETASSNGDFEIWEDTETGTQYIVYDNKSGYGGMGGVCPRYNLDGTLYGN